MSGAKRAPNDLSGLQGGARGGTLGGRIALRMAGRLSPALLLRLEHPEYPWRKRKKDAPRDPSVQLGLPGIPRKPGEFKGSARAPTCIRHGPTGIWKGRVR